MFNENWVTITMRHEADADCLKKPPYQIWTQYNLRQRSFRGFTLVAIAIPRNNHSKYKLNKIKTKKLLGFHSGGHSRKVTIAIRYVADADFLKEPPQEISAQYDPKTKELFRFHFGCHDN